jgi:integrase
MPIRRDPRTGSWFFRAWVAFPDGKRDRVFGTPGVSGPYHDLTNTKVGAQEAERRAIAKVMTGRDVRPAAAKEVPTIKEYSKPFMSVFAASHKPSSRRDKRHRLDAYILPAVGDVRLDELRQEHVDRIVAAQLERGLSRKTVNNITAVLSSLVGYAVKNKIIADPGLTYAIKTQRTDVEAVAPEDVDALLEKTDDRRYRIAILLAADAGLRIGEIRALPRLEVNELARAIGVAWSYDRAGNLTETKGWERREVPLSDRLWAEVKASEQPGPLVFARLDGEPIGYDAVRDAIHAIYDRAGVRVPTKPWHSLRHTFGTQLAARGAPINLIQELMGHKSIETTLRYMHTDRAAKRAAIDSLAPVGSHRAAAPKTTRNRP